MKTLCACSFRAFGYNPDQSIRGAHNTTQEKSIRSITPLPIYVSNLSLSLSLLESVLEVLKTDPRLISQDGDLLKNKAQELAYQLDPTIIGLLLKNDLTRSRFFKEIEGCLIFDQHAFVSFVMNKEFLPDSYTSYKNKIGLNIDGKTLDERKEVSLVWAYKDCVLAGGQDKEDSKRDEIFYNETLGSDQIDRLLDPKVFTGFKRIDTDGKHDLKSFRKDENGNITDNLIIKGNNLLALHSLKKQFKGKIKLIYIDPPYNTGTDSFSYNDRFNHSTWLTFMRNRLEVARELLGSDGVIFVQCDDSEQAYLKVLLDEIFTKENFVNCIAVKMSESSGNKMAHTSLKLPKIKEYLLLYKKNNINLNKIKTNKIEWDDEYNYFLENFSIDDKRIIDSILEKEERSEVDILEIDQILEKIYTVSVHEKSKQMSILKENILEWKIKNAYRIVRTAASSSVKGLADDKRKNCNQLFFSVLSKRDKIPYIVKSDYSEESKSPRVQILFAEDFLQSTVCDLWTDINTTGLEAEGGFISLKGGKKPEKLLQRILEMTTNESDLVLDFFGGSGTTGAVAHKMNRQYILTEQMDYIHDLPEQRLINVINGDTTGISESVGWEGGGDVVYMEIACNAERYIEMIRDAQNTDMLLDIWTELKTKSFVNHKLDPKSIDNTLEVFKSLAFSDQQKTLIELIDKNALYKNLSEMDDMTSDVSESNKKLNRDFYNL